MKTIDTCGQKLYSPLIPAVKAMCEATLGEKLEIIKLCSKLQIIIHDRIRK